jgi:hypothetical protein
MHASSRSDPWLVVVSVSTTKASSSREDRDVEAPLLETIREPLRPWPVRAVHAGLQFVFIVFGKEYGWAGFCLLVVGTACSVATSVHVNWLGGCAIMMVFFATIFCFAGYQAVSGKYELARPLMLSAMMMFLSCILGGHFFVVWSKSATSETYKNVALADMPKKVTSYSENSLFFLKDGSVSSDQQGAFKLCKDKLPVVGTCVYNYYCVAPILPDDYKKGETVYAWAGIMAHVECTDSMFFTSPPRKVGHVLIPHLCRVASLHLGLAPLPNLCVPFSMCHFNKFCAFHGWTMFRPCVLRCAARALCVIADAKYCLTYLVHPLPSLHRTIN